MVWALVSYCVVDNSAGEVTNEKAFTVGHLTMTFQLRVAWNLRQYTYVMTSHAQSHITVVRAATAHCDAVVILVAFVNFFCEVVERGSRQFRLFVQQRKDADALSLNQV